MSEPVLRPIVKRSGATLAFLVITVLLAIGYSVRERNVAKQNAAQNAQLNAALQQTRSDLSALTDKINLMNQPQLLPTPLAPSEAKPAATVKVQQQSVKLHKNARKADDPRWKKFQSQLDEQGKQIQSTQSDLANARTELSGSIARTHDELVVLQKKGERNYYEFDISKSKQYARTGPMGVRLRKANVKHQYADLQLMVDDADLTKKHVNLFEPVMFYTADGGQPAELVINSITKDHIRGYISEPKYRKSELATMSASTQQQNTAAQPSAPEASPRKKLQLPQ